MDADYPDTEELKLIVNWTHTDFWGLLAFVRERWQFADCGYWKEDSRRFHISTGGWSGNEDLIGAMAENRMFWLMCWHSSRRGGHYEFELPYLGQSQRDCEQCPANSNA